MMVAEGKERKNIGTRSKHSLCCCLVWIRSIASNIRWHRGVSEEEEKIRRSYWKENHNREESKEEVSRRIRRGTDRERNDPSFIPYSTSTAHLQT